MNRLFGRIKRGLRRRAVHLGISLRIRYLAGEVARHAPPAQTMPVVVFNASTRLGGLNQNSAFSLLSTWGLRLAGTPVVHFVCAEGLRPCILGTDRPGLQKMSATASAGAGTASLRNPPCAECIAQSRTNTAHAETCWFSHHPNPELEAALQGLDLSGLSSFTYRGMPLGELVLPSVRWILRRQYLLDDESTHYLFRQYILSAWNVAEQFSALLERVKPGAVLVFNGITYPEAAARWAARQCGIRVITHEVSLQPYSGFFTEQDATFRLLPMPSDFDLTPEQSKRLDAYLEQRFHGNFTMAGVRFWKEMRSLGDAFWQRAATFRQVVAVFTNVIFDTSQFHANTVFEDMFDWLETILAVISFHPETFFVIRAHPDETRPGKESINSVAEWVQRNRVDQLPNVLFVPPTEYFSSYELISRCKFVMVYTSTIGLESTLMGAPVLCGGNSQYNQLPTAFCETTPQAYRRKMEAFLDAEKIEVPPEYPHNARRFLYFALYRASLPFGDFIMEDGVWQGYVRLKPFGWEALKVENSPLMRAVVEGIVAGKPFVVGE